MRLSSVAAMLFMAGVVTSSFLSARTIRRDRRKNSTVATWYNPRVARSKNVTNSRSPPKLFPSDKHIGFFSQLGNESTAATGGPPWVFRLQQAQPVTPPVVPALAPPKRLLSIFGLEDSGTKFVSRMIAEAAGVSPNGRWSGTHLSILNADTEVQHISLPWGGGMCGANLPTLDRVDVFDPRFVFPTRFLVNVSSHVLWHEAQGRDVTALFVVRDPPIQAVAKLAHHCGYRAVLANDAENRRAAAILREAMKILEPRQRVIVSLETLMLLKDPYIQDLYASLNIASDYVPNVTFATNSKYLKATTLVKPPKSDKATVALKEERKQRQRERQQSRNHSRPIRPLIKKPTTIHRTPLDNHVGAPRARPQQPERSQSKRRRGASSSANAPLAAGFKSGTKRTNKLRGVTP